MPLGLGSPARNENNGFLPTRSEAVLIRRTINNRWNVPNDVNRNIVACMASEEHMHRQVQLHHEAGGAMVIDSMEKFNAALAVEMKPYHRQSNMHRLIVRRLGRRR